MTRTRSLAAMLGVVAATLLIGLPSRASASPQGLRPLYLTAQEILCISEGRWCAPERLEAPTARELVARAVARQAADRRIQAMVARTELAVPPATVSTVEPVATPAARGARGIAPPARPVGGCLGHRC
jgi:hypothetical protein